ncbi:hypothetical protein D3C79_1048040 [compost metagenome]
MLVESTTYAQFASGWCGVWQMLPLLAEARFDNPDVLVQVCQRVGQRLARHNDPVDVAGSLA